MFTNAGRAFPHALNGVTPEAMSKPPLQEQHELSFPPVEPTGKGRGRLFAYSDAQWKELHDAASNVTGDERKALCEAYFVGYQTLQKKAGVAAAPARPTKKRAARAPRQMSVFEQIEALSEDVDELLAQLEDEQEELRERIAEIDKKKELLKKVAALKLD